MSDHCTRCEGEGLVPVGTLPNNDWDMDVCDDCDGTGADPERAAWLAARRSGLGASDAAAVCGVDPWQSPWTLWLEKTGQTPGDDRDNEAMRWGRLLEGVVANEVAERTGLTIHRTADDLTTRVHPDHPWMRATPDGFATDTTGGILDEHLDGSPLLGPGLLEVKTASAWKADEWADGHAPLHYHLQVQHALAVTGCAWAVLAALVGGQRLVIRWIARDDALIADLIGRERDWWTRHVEGGEPPPVDDHQATADALDRLHADADPNAWVIADAGLADAIDDYRRWRDAAKAAEDSKRGAASRIKAHLGDAEAAYPVDAEADAKPVVTWRTQTRRRIDHDALRRDHPDVAEKVTVTDTGRRINVPKEK